MTNEEKIKQMTTEELANFLGHDNLACNHCIYKLARINCLNNGCSKGIAEWLRQEAKPAK